MENLSSIYTERALFSSGSWEDCLKELGWTSQAAMAPKFVTWCRQRSDSGGKIEEVGNEHCSPPSADPVEVLQRFHPDGPWHLVAMLPDGKPTTRTFTVEQTTAIASGSTNAKARTISFT